MKQTHFHPKQGFALVVTLSLMILLTVIAVGLLTLSTISLRAASHSEAVATARANAKLALMLAIGELQKSAGADQNITASARLLDPAAPPWTGVWKAADWDIKSLQASQYEGKKTERFRHWLISHPSPAGFTDQAAWKSAVDLKSVSLATPEKDPAAEFRAPLVPLAGKSLPGAFSWLVVDENQKARMNTRRRNETGSIASRWSHMGDPGRSAPEAVASLTVFPVNDALTDRLISTATLPLLDSKLASSLDGGVTSYSNSLMTNVVKGGLRKDLSLLSEQTTLPSPLAGTRIYTSDLGSPSNPNWSYLHAWLGLWKSVTMNGGSPGMNLNSVPPAPATNTPEIRPNLLPDVAKIQIHFAAMAVQGWLNNNWQVEDKTEKKTFNTETFLVLRFAPVITLHNPYTVPVTVNRMSVVFEDLPIGFRFFVNDRPFSSKLVPFNYLNAAANDKGGAKQSFRAIIGGTGGPQTLAPGEVALFSPNIDPERGLDQQFAEVNKNDNNVVGEIQCRRGWVGGGAGFYFWHLSPTGGYQNSPDYRRWYNNFQTRTIPLKPDDRVEVRYGIVEPAGVASGTIPIRVNYTTGGGTDQTVRTHQLTYDSVSKLESAMAIASGKIFTTPRAYNVGTEMEESASKPLKEFSNIINLGVLSLRTQNAAFDATGDYASRFPARPWMSGKAITASSRINVSSTEYRTAPYEVAFHQTSGSGNDSGQPGSIERNGDRGFHITGHQASDGANFGSTYDFPIAPPQTLADLAHANLASSSPNPRVTYAVGASDAPAATATTSFRQAGASGMALDQSFLANEALWDDWYLSALTSRDYGIFSGGDSKDLRQVIDEFTAGQPGFSERLRPYFPTGQSPSEVGDILAATDGYLKVAAHQRLAGGFNVNSVSVDAWTAMLGSLNEVDAPLLDSLTKKLETTSLAYSSSRFHMPNAATVSGGTLGADTIAARNQRQQAARNLSEDQIRLLAREIVAEVRARGPFLSLAEFVNRRLGPSSDFTQRGALQQAINNSGINQAAEVDGVTLSGAVAPNKEALSGNSAYGSPAFVMQQDLLRNLGPAIHVRGDTFVIRAYGRADSKSGALLAQTWCEAVVERVPDFIDSTDTAATPVSALTLPVNQTFGRRFVIVSFRYLNSPRDA
jgi:hypothetical protein